MKTALVFGSIVSELVPCVVPRLQKIRNGGTVTLKASYSSSNGMEVGSVMWWFGVMGVTYTFHHGVVL